MKRKEDKDRFKDRRFIEGKYYTLKIRIDRGETICQPISPSLPRIHAKFLSNLCVLAVNFIWLRARFLNSFRVNENNPCNKTLENFSLRISKRSASYGSRYGSIG